MMEACKENNKALESFNKKILEIMVDRVVLASNLLFFLYKRTKPEHTNQFKLVNDPDLKKVNDLLMKTLPVALYENLLKFRDTDKKFEVKRNLLKKITNQNYSVDLAISLEKYFVYEYTKETYIDKKASGNKQKKHK